MTGFAEGLNDAGTGFMPGIGVGPSIEPLIRMEGNTASGLLEYEVMCRDCGSLMGPSARYAMPIVQAGLVRDRHLAEHLAALANEIKEAAR